MLSGPANFWGRTYVPLFMYKQHQPVIAAHGQSGPDGFVRVLRFAGRYNDAVEAAGGTAALRDTWCQYVALRRPERYLNADVVSALRVAALGLNGVEVIDLLALVPHVSHADTIDAGP